MESMAPAETRWESSMRVCRVGEGWSMVPLQSGQCSPQPAPEPVARTTAPQRMVAMKKASVAQAKRRRAGVGVVAADGSDGSRNGMDVARVVMDCCLLPKL